MNNIIDLMPYVESTKIASFETKLSIVKNFASIIDDTKGILNEILNVGIIDSSKHAKFITGNTLVIEFIDTCDAVMVTSPQRLIWIKQKNRYKLISAAIMGCYTSCNI